MIQTQTFILFSTSLHLLVAAVIVSFALVISSCCSSVEDITEITCNTRPKGPRLVVMGPLVCLNGPESYRYISRTL